MSVHPHPEKGPAPERGDHAGTEHQQQQGGPSEQDRDRLRQVHADPDQINQEAQEQQQRREAAGRGQMAANGVNDPEHYRLAVESRAHGAHGKGFSDEELLDEQATDTGDSAQLRTAGGGGDNPPEPNAFRENSPGHMGGAGWGSEQVGGSTVDRRPPNPKKHSQP